MTPEEQDASARRRRRELACTYAVCAANGSAVMAGACWALAGGGGYWPYALMAGGLVAQLGCLGAFTGRG